MPDPTFQYWRVEVSESGEDPWSGVDEGRHGTLDGAILHAQTLAEGDVIPQHYRIVHNDGGTGGVGGIETVVWPEEEP